MSISPFLGVSGEAVGCWSAGAGSTPSGSHASPGALAPAFGVGIAIGIACRRVVPDSAGDSFDVSAAFRSRSPISSAAALREPLPLASGWPGGSLSKSAFLSGGRGGSACPACHGSFPKRAEVRVDQRRRKRAIDHNRHSDAFGNVASLARQGGDVAPLASVGRGSPRLRRTGSPERARPWQKRPQAMKPAQRSNRPHAE